MPVSFLTARDRERLQSFPEEISSEDISSYFTLSSSDLTGVNAQRGSHNRLGFALILCTLRYLGFVPDSLRSVSALAMEHVAGQVGADPDVLGAYGRRDATRSRHFHEVLTLLGFRKAAEEDLQAVTSWLVSQALEHDRPSLLFQLACQQFYRSKIVRPGVTRVEKLVATARARAQQATYDKLRPLLTEGRQRRLDQLLVVDDTMSVTPLTWLRQTATANSAPAILMAIAKLDYVRSQDVASWDLSAINPNRLKLLAQAGRRSTSQMLQRASVGRRYPILVAFLHQTLIDVTDEIIELYDRCLNNAYARSRRDLEEFRRSVSRSANEKVRLLRQLGALVLDDRITDEDLRAAIYEHLSPQRLDAIIQECDQITRPARDHYYDFLGRRYSYIRQFAPAFLDAFVFRAKEPKHPLLTAITVLRALNQEGQREVPVDAPCAFVPTAWRRFVVGEDGGIDRRYWELCLLWELRNALRAGDVWLEHSGQYANPDSYLISVAEWPTLREELCGHIQAPLRGEARLRERADELENTIARVDGQLAAGDELKIVDGKLSAPNLTAETIPESAQALEARIRDRVPRIELADLLVEVDQWTQFSRSFEHVSGSEPRTPEFLTHLYASLFAQACNFGLPQFAAVADLSRDRLAWCTNWYIRDATLTAAITRLVNYHHRLALSALWGGGTLSSSDGQRFPVSVRSKRAAALPRYFGYGRGLTFYTWTSDQYSQYGSKVIVTTVREATHVLDAILDNQTDLPIAEHTTDTAGYTELVFALFDLLGLQFSPRIRAAGDQRLYRMDRQALQRHLDPALGKVIRQDLILRHWDDMLRLAASLRRGQVTASLYISKLQAHPRQSAFAQALQEYGRLVKTIFILRYFSDEVLRRRINRQLNKGEALHALRKFLFFANAGKIRKRQDEDQLVQVGCLNLVTNAIIVWNTVHMARAIEDLRAAGEPVADEDVSYLSPARYGHINPYGKYSFEAGDLLDDALLDLEQKNLPGFA